MASATPWAASLGARVIAVTSGKGGVGKSVISANVAVACASQGRRVLLIDADLALANLDLLLGVEARYTVRDVLDGKASIEEAIVEGPRGVSLLAACSGDVELAALGGKARMNLFDAIDSLEQRYDTVIVDTVNGVAIDAGQAGGDDVINAAETLNALKIKN